LNKFTYEFLFALNHVKIEVQATQVSQQDSVTVTQENMATVSHLTKKPSKQNDKALKPCWNPPAPLSKFSPFMITLGFVAYLLIIEAV